MSLAVVWDNEHRSRAWGSWPNEHLVRFVARYYGATKVRPEVQFLEVGCGAGANAVFLMKEGYSICALDFSDAAVSRTTQRLLLEPTRSKQTIGAAVCSATKLPARDAWVDCVVDVACLQCLDDSDVKIAVREIVRTLKPGGRLFSYHASAAGWPGVHTTGAVYPRRAHEVVSLFGAPLESAHYHDQYERPHPTESGRKVLVAHWIIEGRKPNGT